MASALPLSAAECSGVSPHPLSSALGSAPAARSALMASAWRAAKCSGVGPPCPAHRRRPEAQPGSGRCSGALPSLSRVGIGAGGQKRRDNRRVDEPGRRVQRGLAILVLRVGIGAAGQKRRDGRRVAELGRQVQRGPAILVLRVGIGAGGQKRIDGRRRPSQAAQCSGVLPSLSSTRWDRCGGRPGAH